MYKSKSAEIRDATLSGGGAKLTQTEKSLHKAFNYVFKS